MTTVMDHTPEWREEYMANLGAKMEHLEYLIALRGDIWERVVECAATQDISPQRLVEDILAEWYELPMCNV